MTGFAVRRAARSASALGLAVAALALLGGCGGESEVDLEAEGANLEPQVVVEHPVDSPAAAAKAGEPVSGGDAAAAPATNPGAPGGPGRVP